MYASDALFTENDNFPLIFFPLSPSILAGFSKTIHQIKQLGEVQYYNDDLYIVFCSELLFCASDNMKGLKVS